MDERKFSRRTRRSTCGAARRGAPPSLHYHYYYCCWCLYALCERFNPIYWTSQSTEPILLHAVCLSPHPCLPCSAPVLWRCVERSSYRGPGLSLTAVLVLWNTVRSRTPTRAQREELPTHASGPSQNININSGFYY